MSYTGSELLAILEKMASRKARNPNTTAALRSAVVAVLSAWPNWHTTDLASIDVSQLFRTFEEFARQKHYASKTIEVYKSRFQTALRWADEYCVISGLGADSKVSGEQPTPHSGVRTRTAHVISPTSTGTSPVRLVTHSFPLRASQMAILHLPVDLTTAEARRLSAFLATLAMDYEAKD